MSDGNLTSPLSPKPSGERRRRRRSRAGKGEKATNGKKEKSAKGEQLLWRAFYRTTRGGRSRFNHLRRHSPHLPSWPSAPPPSLNFFSDSLPFPSLRSSSSSSSVLPLHLFYLYPAAVTVRALTLSLPPCVCSSCTTTSRQYCDRRCSACFVCSRHLTPNSILTGHVALPVCPQLPIGSCEELPSP